MRTSKVSLYFDVVSPYTYLNLVTWSRYLRLWPSVDLALRPVFLGGIMKATGNKPPGMLRQKHAFMMQDLRRCSQQATFRYWMFQQISLSKLPEPLYRSSAHCVQQSSTGIPKSNGLTWLSAFRMQFMPILHCVAPRMR